MGLLMRWTLLAGLAASALWDLRKRAVPGWFLAGVTAVLFAEGLAGRCLFSLNVLAGVLPGLWLLLLGVLFREKIGTADGVVFVWTGMVLGAAPCLWILSASLLLTFLGGTVWLIVKRRKSVEVPLIPLVLLLYAGGWIVGG